MRLPVFIIVSLIVALRVEQSAQCAITYVDANLINTTLGGAHLVSGSNFSTETGEGAANNLWQLRSGIGNEGDIWTADESGAGDMAPLVTTISFPEAGGYHLFAYVWDSESATDDWDIVVRVGDYNFFKVQSSEVEPAHLADFAGPIVACETPRRLMQIPLGVVSVSAGGAVVISVDDNDDLQRTWYDGVGYEKVFGTIGERIIAFDCNKTNSPAAPTQALFRSLSGSSTTSQNSTNIVKSFGPYTVQLSKSSTTPFDFRGANGDEARVIPGGPTSMSFLVADFLGARDGTIHLSISNLAAGTYLFRSYHLDTFDSSNLGFAQGSSPTTQNTLRAHVSDKLEAIVQPTALGASGLNTTFISDTDIPTLSFPFNADGTNAVKIKLSTVYTNGADSFILLNGFEIFSTTP